MSARDEDPILILTDRARDTRRTVDPVAWVVLEELVLRSETTPKPASVRIDVRSLATALGRSKDAVGRALRVLTQAGLVERETSRDELTGRFSDAAYRVDLDLAGLRRPVWSSSIRHTGNDAPPPLPSALSVTPTGHGRLFES